MTHPVFSGLPRFYQKRYREQMKRQSGHSRRTFLACLGGGATLAAAAGMPFGTARAATTLNYICWEGYNAPEIVGPLTASHDIELNFDFITDSAGAFAKLAAGAWRDFDVISSDVPWIQRMGEAGLCEFLDPADFGDLNDELFPEFSQPFEPLIYDGKTTGIPTRWGWVGANINTDHSDPDDWTSYDACFDAANRGRIGVMDWGDWPLMPIMLHAGIDPFTELDDAALGECRRVFAALLENVGAIVGDMTLAQKGLLDGSMLTFLGCGNYCTSGLRKSGHTSITTIVPEPRHGLKQGVIWLEATGIVKDPVDMQAAQQVVRHMVSRPVAANLAWTDWTSCPTTNRHFAADFDENQHEVVQTAYMWEAWQNSQTYRIMPSIDAVLQVWQEEVANR